MDDGFGAKEKAAMDAEKVIGKQSVEDATEEILRTQTNASEPGLPFSKARTVALVATVAAAPFLSVRVALSHLIL